MVKHMQFARVIVNDVSGKTVEIILSCMKHREVKKHIQSHRAIW